MAQTTQYGYVEAASGNRLIMQVGRHAFATTGLTSRITVGFERLIAGHLTPAQALTSAAKTSNLPSYIPYIGSAQITQHITRIVIVSRLRGIVSGLTYDYTLYGQ